LAQALTQTYGLPRYSFREFMFFEMPDEPSIYAVVAGAEHPQTREALLNLGWRALDAPLPEGRPTATFLAVIGVDATRNVLDVDDVQAARFMNGRVLECPADADARILVVRQGHRVLGALDAATGCAAV
jgi:hypothetical protein